MNRSIRNTVSGFFILHFLFLNLALGQSEQYISIADKQPSRLGLYGYFGYLITNLDKDLRTNHLRIGDVIIRTDKCQEPLSRSRFLSEIRGTSVGSDVKIDFVRFNERSATVGSAVVQTLPYVEGASRLGVVGTFGFLIESLAVENAHRDIEPGDFIAGLKGLGQLGEFDIFRSFVRTYPRGQGIEASIFRIDEGTLSERKVTMLLNTFPPHSSNSSATLNSKCKLGGCSWCCDTCTIIQNCGTTNCETSHKCLQMSGPCNFLLCV